MAKKMKCSFCDEVLKLARKFSSGSRLICDKCNKIHCAACREEMTEKEVQLLPKINSFHVCRTCYEKWFKETGEKEKKALQAHLEFQLKYQVCVKCGELNDSRNDDGSIEYRFCIACRTKAGDHSSLQGREVCRNKWQQDERVIPFDRLGVGFKTRT